MDQDTTHMVAASKVHMLKLGEYELCRMRMEQYIQMIDYSLWEVIENGNAPLITKFVEGVETTIAPTTAEERVQRRLELKSRSTLLMGIPNEHQLKFNSIKDAKVLDQTFDGFKSFISQLEIHGESISQEDVNQKFLRNMSPEWNTHTIVKGTSRSSTITSNVAFVFANSSTNGAINTAHGATTASTQATAVNLTTIDNLSDVVICAFFASQPNSLISPRWSVIIAIKGDTLQGSAGPQGTKKTGKGRSEKQEGLESVEARLIVYKKNESVYKEDIKIVDKCKTGLGYNVVPPPYTGNFMRPKPDLSFSGLEEFTSEPIVIEPIVKKLISTTTSSTNEVVNTAHGVSTASTQVNAANFSNIDSLSDGVISVQMKSGLVSINTTQQNISKIAVSVNTARQVNIAHSKTTVNAARPMVNTVSGKKINTARTKAIVNAVKGNNVNDVKGNNVNDVKASACWVWKPKTKVLDYGNLQIDLIDQGVIDSGCSRHMTGNMSCLTYYKEIDGGYVAFGGNPKGRKITEKAMSDESKLWHRRVGNLNLKTMNKLVKGNLVRGLPSKLFENDQAYVACQKGKQHKPLDETSGILNSFITGIENLVDHKVKVIRCDNETEFKNREMNQFCKMKSILKQFSVARTPQQNGVAERRNRTLIEATKTMLADSKLPNTFWAKAV
ncbi:putative ribonuclease H-like domain-containing protein, partial [Tanacetum coccineum]